MCPAEQSFFTSLASHCRSWGEQLETDPSHRVGRAEFVFPPDYAAFQGHFPGRPVLPAVVQLAAIRFLAERLIGVNLRPSRFYRTKFRGVILPGEPVELFLELEQDGTGWSGSFSWHQLEGAGQLVARGCCGFVSDTGEDN